MIKQGEKKDDEKNKNMKRSEEHTSELSHRTRPYAVFRLKKKKVITFIKKTKKRPNVRAHQENAYLTI